MDDSIVSESLPSAQSNQVQKGNYVLLDAEDSRCRFVKVKKNGYDSMNGRVFGFEFSNFVQFPFPSLPVHIRLDKQGLARKV